MAEMSENMNSAQSVQAGESSVWLLSSSCGSKCNSRRSTLTVGEDHTVTCHTETLPHLLFWQTFNFLTAFCCRQRWTELV